MNSTVDIPLTKVFVDNKYLGLEAGVTEAYWYGITSIPARQFLCHVMLYNGSNWYGLPLVALSTKPIHLGNVSESQAYDCFSYDITCIRFTFLRDQRATILSSHGTYLFTVISHDDNGRGPFAEFPEQAKTFTFIGLDDGRIVFRHTVDVENTQPSVDMIDNMLGQAIKLYETWFNEISSIALTNKTAQEVFDELDKTSEIKEGEEA